MGYDVVCVKFPIVSILVVSGFFFLYMTSLPF
jgi:hypothetical protein